MENSQSDTMVLVAADLCGAGGEAVHVYAGVDGALIPPHLIVRLRQCAADEQDALDLRLACSPGMCD